MNQKNNRRKCLLDVRHRPRHLLDMRRFPILAVVVVVLLSNSKSSFVHGEINVEGNSFGYEANTDVAAYLKLALDIRDMRLSSNFTAKKDIYENGKNTGTNLTLQSLALQLEDNYRNTPMFNLYKASFDYLGKSLEGDDEGNFDGSPIDQYANTLVADLFDLSIPYIEATGSLVYAVTQVYWGQLWKVLDGCRAKDTTAMNTALDIAVALYIGQDQERNENNKGYMLYNLAETAGAMFGQDDGEAEVNKATLDTFLVLQKNIQNGLCSTDADGSGYREMRTLVRKLYIYTNRMLVQILLMYIKEVDSAEGALDFIEMYSLSIWAQIHMCNPTLAETIAGLTITADVTTTTQSEAIKALQQAYTECLGLTCEDVGSYNEGAIPQCTDDTAFDTPFASYTPTTDVRDISRLDLDLLDIKMFMKNDAYAIALDVYTYGWNTKQYALQQLAQCQVSGTNSSQCDFIRAYQSSNENEYFDTIIISLLGNAEGTGTDMDPVRSAVDGMMQGIAMYLGVAGFLQGSVDACASGSTNVVNLWESAIALFIGSLASRTDSMDDLSFYGLAEKYCGQFGTCGTDDDASAVVNQIIIDAMVRGAQGLSSGCDESAKLVEETIMPALLIPLIQGYLDNLVFSATADDIGSGDGYALAFSKAILPFIDAANKNSAATIIQVSPSDSDNGGEINTTAAFDAIRTALVDMPYMNCSAIGKYNYNNTEYGLCVGDLSFPNLWDAEPPSDSSPPGESSGEGHDETKITVEPHPEGLAWGRYEFTDESAAENFANLTLAIKGMYYAKSETEVDSYYSNLNGATDNVTFGSTTIGSLKEFSTKAYTFMDADPIYNFFRYALFEDSTFDDPSGVADDGWAFENAVESLAVGPDNGNSPELASETTVVLGIWHVIAHFLYETSRSCSSQKETPQYIDYAVALWIGQEQAEGKYNSGWSIYSIAQQAAENFGLAEGEAVINTVLMEQFKTAKTLASQCSTNTTVSQDLRILVDDMLKSLSIPLAQNLLFYISDNDYQYVELYSLALIPQAISCDVGVYATLRDQLFDSYTQDKFDFVELDDLAIAFHCLRFECDDFANGDESRDAGSLGFLVSTLCDELDFRSSSMELSSYTIDDADTIELARLDLDALQMELFARVNQFDLAYDVYENGRNSRNSKGYNTLKDLAIASAGDLYDNYSSYFGVHSQADEVITSALKPVASAGAETITWGKRRQVSEISFRTVQTSITFLAVIGRLYEAVNLCRSDKDGKGKVDEAVALYVGSIEGPIAGGSEYNSGKFLYAFAKEFCEEFDKCDNHTDAKSNEFLLFAFEDFKDNIASSECDAASAILKADIQPIIETVLLQGLLHYAVVNKDVDGKSGNETIAAGAAVALSILPLVNQANETSAKTIESTMSFTISNQPTLNDSAVVFEAVSGALDGMDVDCNNVGIHISGLSVCGESSDAPPLDTPTDLGGDLYVSSTYVQDKANIALDIKKMEESLSIGRQTTAMLIYTEGENSNVYDASGKLTDVRSLQSFSFDAWQNMKNNPLYQMTVFALRDSKKQFGGVDAFRYADTIVQQSFANGKDNKLPLAAEAALALNLWMELANDLYETAARCKNASLTDDDGAYMVDGAAAYWIGDGHDPERGHLFYALAEEMGDQFGLNSDGQSRTNHNILLFFHQLKMLLSQSDACSDAETVRRVRHNIDKIISIMIALQAQALIHNLLIEDKDRIPIYANAFVPLVIGCSPTTFAYLKAHLLDSTLRESEVADIVAAIRSTLPCFSLSCDDIGKHKTEDDLDCTDPNTLTSLTGYKPTQDVREYAKLDLDILELDILLQMEAYEAASDLYTYGKHASMSSGSETTALSLKYLATNSGRTVVPQFASFKRYFANDDRYADTLVLKSFDTENNWKLTQRRAVAVGVSQFMIVYMAALQAMYDSVAACSSSGAERSVTAAKDWDNAAAFIIGSLEGTSEAGTDDGNLFWHLGKEFCNEFGTCSSEVQGSSVNNDRVDTLLYAGRGAIISGNCDELRKAAHDLSPLLLIPLVQGSLIATIKLTSRSTRTADREQIQAEAFVFAQSLLPLIQDGDRQAATDISHNFPLTGTTVPDGRGKVATAYSKVLQHLGVQCGDVGVSKEINVCSGGDDKPVGLIVGTVLGSVAIVGLFLLFRRKKKNLPENKPEFIEANGELNHTSELLAKSPDVSYNARSDAETECLNGGDADAAMPEDDDAYVKAIARALDERDANDDQEHAPKVNGAQIV